MPRIGGQFFVYAALGVVLLLVGLNSIRGEKSGSAAPPAGTATSGDAPAPGGDGGFEVTGGSRRIVVDVAGAVRRPGVYRFSQGARVIDAIAKAGGVARQAMVGGINRAATLSDGQQVVVPSAAAGGGASAAAGAAGAGGGAEGGGGGPVSLGTASQAQLEEIDGIGPVTARKIIEFRDSHGGLGSVDELDRVSGIGPVTMESLRAALTP